MKDVRDRRDDDDRENGTARDDHKGESRTWTELKPIANRQSLCSQHGIPHPRQRRSRYG